MGPRIFELCTPSPSIDLDFLREQSQIWVKSCIHMHPRNAKS